MGKYRKILVPFDGSVSSKNALKQAIKLSQKEKSWIKVVVVVPAYEGDLELVGVSNIKKVIEGPTEKLLDEARDIADAERATIITNIEHGVPYKRVVDVADTENCDLIVMGRRGLHRIERVMMGSVTSRVIGHTKKDVLVVPRYASIGWEKILLATDGSKYSKGAIEHAINFANSYAGELIAVSVVNTTEEFFALAPQVVDGMIEKSKGILEDVKKKAKASNVKIETAVREGEAFEKIVELAKIRKADVIFMGSHGRTGVQRLLMGSVTEKVIGYTLCPVMVVRS